MSRWNENETANWVGATPMPVSKTKQLAKKLGLLKRRPRNEDTDGNTRKRRRRGQFLSYVIVIDFESTCWEDRKGQQEIIEFPAVLLDLLSGELLDEFHQYVQPQENIKLSQFCTDLTGITQDQVDNGIPLQTCLYLFSRWIEGLRTERGVVLLEPGKEFSEDLSLCALVSWSDWDFGVCLNYECQRKQLRKPAYFSQWIDIRAVYKTFYDRYPSGLSGALEDLGIAFSGRQHCGLDDARNTAKLCYRMVRDGCRLNITKCIQKGQCRIVKPASSTNNTGESHSGSADSKETPAPLTSSKQTLAPPTLIKQTLSPSTSSKQTLTSTKQISASPTSSKQVVAPLTSSKQVLAPPTSSKQVLAPPTSSKQVLAPPTSSKQVPAPPTSSKQVLAPPTSSKQVLAPPTSSKQVLAPPHPVSEY